MLSNGKFCLGIAEFAKISKFSQEIANFAKSITKFLANLIHKFDSV